MAGFFAGTPEGWFAAAGTLSLAWPGAIFCRRLGWDYSGAVLLPFLFPLLFACVGRSAFRTLWQNGIYWRATFYSLPELRKGNISWL
jgi:hypothetical protein